MALSFAVMLVFAGAAAAEKSPRSLVAIANQAYAAGDYERALAGYNQAELAMPESPELAYDQGLAQYKLGDFSAARNLFLRALSTRDLGLEANAKFNLGNVAYSSALEKKTAPKEALDNLRQAISHYRDSLDLQPDDEDAKANIHMAQLLMKDLLDKLKKQQEQQKKDQQNKQDQNKQNKQDKQNQDKKDQQKQSSQDDQKSDQKQQQQDKGQQSQQKSDQQKKADEQKQPQGSIDRKDETDADKQQAQPMGSNKQMTKREAERLLQAVRDKERKRREDKARRLRARRASVLKDW